MILAFGLGLIGCFGGSPSAGRPTAEAAPKTRMVPESLSPPGEQELRAIVASGRLPELQWPNFSAHSQDVKEFYEEGGYKLGWSQGAKPTAQALELIEILQHAEQKGLDSKDYDGDRWPDRLKTLQSTTAASESLLVKFDVALTVSATRYLSDLHLGKVDPEALHKDFDPEREKHNPGAYLWQDVIAASNVKDALAPVECQYPGYKREEAALQKYLAMAKEEVSDPLPQVQKPIQQGQNYEGSAKLVKRLQFLGDVPLSVIVPEGSQLYSKAEADGVKRFQTRHGLEAEGKLGPQTIVELNRPMSFRVNQLRFSLERWRWLPDNFKEPPIMVNIPEFLLRTMNPTGEYHLTMRVVVGRAMRTETPVLEEDMKYVVFWPYWNVPSSILRSEFLPKIAKDPAYLQKHEYEVASYAGQVVTDGVVSPDVLAQLRAGKLMVRQRPGPNNALGLIKFIFPNDKNIYLHSTPAQSLFGKTRRDFSHGCIRVVDPAALAEWVLRNNPGWTRERIDAALKAQKEQQVNLTRTIPVLILYSTAVAEEDGQVYFFNDIYGHDTALAKLYDKSYASRN
jgi:L,D-transpeptidase YcbB